MTIEEKLKEYKDKNLSFYEAYIDCTPIEEIEGCIIENAVYSGYRITTKNGNSFFTDYGIRGIEKGTFYIKNGQPHKIINMPNSDTLCYIGDIISSMENINYSRFDITSYLRINWFK